VRFVHRRQLLRLLEDLAWAEVSRMDVSQRVTLRTIFEQFCSMSARISFFG
jgi:hypothetical protein